MFGETHVPTSNPVGKTSNNESENTHLVFLDTFTVDPVSVSHCLVKIKQQPTFADAVKVIWPKELSQIEEHILKGLHESNSQLTATRFKNEDRDELARWVFSATNAIEELNNYKKLVEKRVPYFLMSMATIQQNNSFVSHERLRMSVSWFFSHAILHSSLPVARCASFRPIRDEKMLAPWNHIFEAGYLMDELLKALYKVKDTILSARILKVADHYLDHDGSGYEYFFGPAGAVLECSEQDNKPFFASSLWYYEWVIPQLEIMLAKRCSTVEVNYDLTVVPTGVVKNHDGDEVWKKPAIVIANQ